MPARTRRPQKGPCKNAVVEDGRVLVECPHGGRALFLRTVIVGQPFELRGLCPGCTADLEVAEADEERRRRELRLTQVVPQRMRAWSLEGYPTDGPGREKAKRMGERWLAGWRRGRRRDLVLWGDAGRGKTGLAVGLLREVILTDGILDVDFVNFRHLLAEMRAAIAEQRRGGEPPEVAARRRRLLVVDDLGAERPTDWAREQLAELVDTRYLDELATVYTSNYPLDDLAARLGHDDLVVGKRIVSRIVEDAVVVEVTGTDLRTR